MLKNIICIVLTILSAYAFSQKRVVDSMAMNEWPSLGKSITSDDANYLIYTVNNSSSNQRTLFIQGLNSTWKRGFVGADGGGFTEDNRRAFCKIKTHYFSFILDQNILVFSPM